MNKSEIFKKTDKIAQIVFNQKALKKMITLVAMCKKEVAWHGTGYKKGHRRYYIQDIFLYPQKTTATNFVAVDYARWQSDLILNGNEEKLDRLCFHGHSHVDMAVKPSYTDLDFQEDTIEMIQPDRFYIFLIINKSFEYNFRIIDREDNLEYTNIVLPQLDYIIETVKKEYNENVVQIEKKVIEERALNTYKEEDKINEVAL